MKGEEELKSAVQKCFGIQLHVIIPVNWTPMDWFIKRTEAERICCLSVHVKRMNSQAVMVYVIYANKYKRNRRAFGFDIGKPIYKDQERSARKGLAYCRNVLKKLSQMNAHEDMRIYVEKIAEDMEQKEWSES